MAPESASAPYDRGRFEHWIDLDGDGCNTRYEVLIDESTSPVTVSGRCTLTGGTWVSPYDGLIAYSPADIEIDHVIPLAEAWRSGASEWTDARRKAFANDLDVPYALTAASSVSNQSKSDKDPAKWLPTNSAFTCEYVTSWALVKYRWTLTVDPMELAAIQAILSGECGAASITLPTVVEAMAVHPVTPTTFTDVSAGMSFRDEIMWLADRGISTGWADGTFRPYAPVTRDAMAAFMYRLAGSPDFTIPTSSPFLDVPTNYQFYKEISWLATQGITTGWPVSGGQEFRPWNFITRDAMAAFLYRYAGSPAYTPSGSSPFSDLRSTSSFYTEIRWLAARGISTGSDIGYGCRNYEPFGNVKRDAMAAFMYRATVGGTTPVAEGTCSPPAPPMKPTPPVEPTGTYISGYVSPGAFCKKENAGWYGRSKTGVLMRCTTSSSDSRLRWRAV
ncbi:hypothetical protein GCM10025863_13940 [Microbacterium suwonense]|uniref:SLH domain-containing protein n=1 Tax=Microbacterium suwonense TaxID=683047 RepID=A0ABM8FSX8_9MICO|nr:hypothetical protein GCM10025863_13940 [Microbacterium suwonense]